MREDLKTLALLELGELLTPQGSETKHVEVTLEMETPPKENTATPR